MASERDVLPKTVKPSHYAISLYDLKLEAPWTYTGRVDINLAVKESINSITLNVSDVKIHEADLHAGDAKLHSKTISYNEKSQQATIQFESSASASPDAKLSILFEGVMNNSMAGFYRSKYKPAAEPAKSVPRDGEYHCMFSTQFESCSARVAFPCFDEPNLKASFDFEIEIPEDQVALSNMPEKATRKSAKPGWKTVSFEKSPVMSTYLLAWAFGDFEYVEAFTERKYNGKNLPCRVYTTRGLKEQGRFALDHAHKIIDMFSDLFGIEYPLPKSDLLAVHEFSHGAMENWGLVTYRTTAVLFDEEKSDQKFRTRVAYVVAHELAHQWFGNLVTMDWWSELWLNEGFATWVGWVATDRLHPDWKVWPQFVAEGMQTAFTLDALRSSHPIEVPLRDALEVEQVFDSISYLKGSSVIRMLASYLGEDVFIKGVGDYLRKHQYGNATTSDLWQALSQASGQDVASFIDDWIRKIGFPVLTVAEEPGQISVQQSRFLSTGDVQAADDQTTWWLPLALHSGAGAAASAPKALTQKGDTIRGVDDAFYKLNKDAAGFYRTNYPAARLEKFGQSLGRLSQEDKIGLVGDAHALAVSGEGKTTSLLALLSNFAHETDYQVWSSAISALASVRSVFATSDKVSAALKAFTLQLVTPQTERLGWTFTRDEPYVDAQLRVLLIATAGLAGHVGVVQEALRQFDAYFGGDHAAIHSSLRGAVWRIAITHRGQPAYDAVKNEYLTTTSIDGREIALQSMGRVQDPALGKAYFEFLLSDAVPIQDTHSGSMSLAANPATRYLQWQLIQAHWPHVRARLGSNMVVLDRFLRLSLNKFADAAVAAEIAAFFKDKDNRGYDRVLGVLADTIQGNARYRERDEGVLLEWLEARGYKDKL